MSGPKVFEFAKTVGMETLGLMDKLREWNIPVKNHMAELDESMVQLIRTKLEEAREAKKTPAKKAATRKAAAPKAAADKEIEKPKSKVEKPAAKKGEATTNGASKTTKVATKGKVAAGKVIRRKAGEAPPKSEEAEAPEAASVAEAITPPETKTADAQAPVVPETVAPVAEVAPVVAAPQAPVPPAPKIPLRPVKREVVPGTGKAPLSQPSNIIGRIDLNRAQSQRPRPPGSGGQHGGANAGPQVRGTMRAGFQANPNPFIVPEEPGRRDDRRKKTGGFAPRPGGIDESATQKEEEVEVFSATEFRKREIVFQPKKKKTVLARQGMKTAITTPKASKRVVEIYDTIKVADFAKEMGIKAATIIAHLMKQGMMVTQNDSLDFDTAALIAPEFQHEVVNLKKTSADATSAVAFGDLEAERIIRAPVVTVMGHVDHGKTSLLDAIRKADVASGEAGGITQHIGAYQVKLENDQVVTFIDTPGHAAFTAMRARGANVTDIVILVVAADDGVMNQTIEAISHAKAAGVPIIVAVNKMDKPGAQPERIKQQLTEYELVAEEWGGTTVFMPVSALKKTGVKELLEHVLVQAEVLELKANPKRSGTGVVIESKLERGRGIVATMLVKDGTVRLGQSISAGVTFGRVRAMFNDRGQSLKEAGPSMPIEVLGLNETPMAGDTFDICENETAAQELSAHRKEARTKALETPKAKVSLEELFSKVQTGDTKELPIVLKSDVAGSSEALKGMLEKASTEKVKIKIIHSAVGGISESDVLLASSAKGLIIGFNVRPETSAVSLAKSQGVEIKTYSIIYEVVDDLKKAMEGLLAPTIVEKVLGRAEVRNTFSIPKIGTIAGCSVLDGKITRQSLVRLIRDSRVIYDGKLSSLKRFKDDAKEVATGFECGIGIENYNDLKVGDIIEAYERQSVAGVL